MFSFALLSLLIACQTSSDDASQQGPVADPAGTNFSTAPADVAAPPADATITATGLAYKVLEAGTGKDHPKRRGRVEVHYTGWTTDGQMFDSSHKRGKPISFNVSGVIPGWTEALQLMVAGQTSRLWIPEELAYKGRPGRPAGMLVFDVELIKVFPVMDRSKMMKVKNAGLTKAYPAPSDVAAPPNDAKRTRSGLAYKMLSKGKGTRRPGPTDRVEVHYTGWQTDGTTFDTSRKRGKPTAFPLNGVIAGWTEGLQLMVEGEKARLWIPEDLAYQGKPDRPQGMLVFDVELLKIQ